MRTFALIFSLSAVWADHLPLACAVPESAALSVRPIRVLIAKRLPRFRIRTNRACSVEAPAGHRFNLPVQEQWLIVLPRNDAEGIRLGSMTIPQRSVRLHPPADGEVTVSTQRNGKWQAKRTYPGSLHIFVDDKGRLELINEVDVERYVACVVANEVWPTFELEAFRAQAIAARTFVLFQMKRRNRARFDVSATQGSQVYKGIRTDNTGKRATQATADTRGLALTWAEEGTPSLFCAYYSAACGGLSQSASIFGPDNEIKPLAGDVRCTYCKIAPSETYRWDPVSLTLSYIQSRLVAAISKLASLGRIKNIEVIERTASGRAVRVRLSGTNGKTHDLLAERFRLIVNGSKIRSTDFTLRVRNGSAIFDRGRGFGHGLGLCQWGMQGQALEGKHAGDILRYYYPGAAITRVY